MKSKFEKSIVPSTLPAWLRSKEEGVFVLSLHVQPGAKRTAVVGPYGEKLKIALAAPPVDGKANQALLQFLAKALGVPKTSVTLVSGETNREKRVAVRAELATLLGVFSPGENE